MEQRGKWRTSMSGLSRSISESRPIDAIRPFSTRRAPSFIGRLETGRTRLAAKITFAARAQPRSRLDVLDGDAGLQNPVVERGALSRPEAAPLDDAPELFFGGAVAGSGLFYDVLLDHDRTHVVAPGV